MSQENVEVFKRGVEAYDLRDIDALLEDLDPDVEWQPVLQVLLWGEATVYQGHQGVRDWFRDLDAAFAEFHVEVAEFETLEIGWSRAAGCVRVAGQVEPRSIRHSLT
jgi:ketosteroid isomerase-like protein